MYFTYVLRSQKDGNNYSGFTKDLDLRMKQHQQGQVPSTKPRRPLTHGSGLLDLLVLGRRVDFRLVAALGP